MNIKVKRNAFGPQKFSCERMIDIPALRAEPFQAVFIRAPIIVSVGLEITVLAQVPEGIVMARQDNFLVTSFHPEITEDVLVHQYFLDMVSQSRSTAATSANFGQTSTCNVLG